MKAMTRVSIKFKLLILLVTLSMMVLATYAILMLRIFVNDKITYVYDSILLNSRSVANLIRSELDSGVTKVQSVMNYYSYDGRSLSAEGEKWFRADPQWQSLAIFQFNKSVGRHLRTTYLTKVQTKEGVSTALIRQTLQQGLLILSLPDDSGTWLLSVKVQNKTGDGELVVVSRFTNSQFLDTFFKPQVQNSYLAGDDGRIILRPREQAHFVSTRALTSAISMLPQNNMQHFGVLESQQGKLLVSFADVGLSGFRVVSIIPRHVALEAASIIQKESVLFIAVLFCFAIFVSVIGASGLTNSLKRLHLATLEIAKGNLDVRVQEKGRDEVAEVGRGFNRMAGEIKRLLIETAEKVRMEGELKTASIVQSTLFPPAVFSSGRIELRGYYQPASECSGDWWNYVQIGNKIFVMICDATGHGVPAALMTSAARSAVSIIADLPGMTTSKCLELLNSAIFDTSQGRMQMTAFVACIDHKTGEVSFANASHDTPFLLRKGPQPLERKSLETLESKPGYRIGHENEATYESQIVQLRMGDCLLFYTDGLTELKDKNGKDLGIRKLMQGLLKSFNADANIDQLMTAIQETMGQHRDQAPLADDVTFILVKYV